MLVLPVALSESYGVEVLDGVIEEERRLGLIQELVVGELVKGGGRVLHQGF